MFCIRKERIIKVGVFFAYKKRRLTRRFLCIVLIERGTYRFSDVFHFLIQFGAGFRAFFQFPGHFFRKTEVLFIAKLML